jgi:predicted AAA+ superfamily ATPase
VTYRRRTLDLELDQLLDHVPAIAIDGLKAVGKTTTAAQRVRSALLLDDPAVRASVAADPNSILLRERPLLVDEWQQVPEVWDVVRRSVDADRAGGQFLLTGSASPRPGATAHTGAGRIGRLRMRPQTLEERGVTATTVSLADLLVGSKPPLTGESPLALADYLAHIVQSGLPGYRDLGGRALRFALDSYLRTVVDRDVPEAGLAVRRPEVMLRWLRAYAAATSTTTSYNDILNAATPGESDKPAKTTAMAYRDVLTHIWLLDPLPAWSPSGSPLSRLGRSPKHHLADPALAARLLGATPQSLLDGQSAKLSSRFATLSGALFESLATLCVRVAAQAAEAAVGHLRTRNGDHEVDLIVERADGGVVAVEVKLAATIHDADARHLNWLAGELGDGLLDRIILSTGPRAYRRPDGVGVIPLALLGP